MVDLSRNLTGETWPGPAARWLSRLAENIGPGRGASWDRPARLRAGRSRGRGRNGVCVACRPAERRSPRRRSPSPSLFPHCERERAPCTRGGRRPHVLVAARGTSFCKYHLSGEYGFRNANRAEVSKRFSGGEAPRAAEQRGVGAWGALSSAICCGLRRREGRPEGSGWTGNLG